jgi:hypothetical protein
MSNVEQLAGVGAGVAAPSVAASGRQPQLPALEQFKHVDAKHRHVLVQSDAQRIKFMESHPWVEYDRGMKIIDMLTGLMNTPKRVRMPNLLIVGSSNNGKSTLIKRFQELYPHTENEEHETVKAVIVAEAPPTADEKGLYASVLDNFWAPFSMKSSASDLRTQAIRRLRETHCRILVIEELHSLLTGTAREQRQIMNVLKYLCNQLEIPIVGVGTQDARRVLSADAQHSSRFDIVELPDWELNPEFQMLLQALEAALPLKRPSDLHKLPMVKDLHTICAGNLGNLQQLLIECAKEAISSGKEQITLEMVQSRSWLRPTKGLREVRL